MSSENTVTNLARDVSTLQSYSLNGTNPQAREISLLLYSIAERAMRDKDISPQWITLQDLHKQISQISIPSNLPLQTVVNYLLAKAQPKTQPFPLLQLPPELLHSILSFLLHKELGSMSKVCKTTNIAANNEGLWEELCKQEDFKLSQTKLDTQLWKDFYKNEIYLMRYQKGGSLVPVRIGTHSYRITVNKNIARFFDLKKLIYEKNSSISIRNMIFVVNGKLIQDDDNPIGSRIPRDLNCLMVLKKAT